MIPDHNVLSSIPLCIHLARKEKAAFIDRDKLTNWLPPTAVGNRGVVAGNQDEPKNELQSD